MIDPARFLEVCRAQGITFFTGVPDSLLKHLNTQIMATLPREQHVSRRYALMVARGTFAEPGAAPPAPAGPRRRPRGRRRWRRWSTRSGRSR
jgi:hypothetical protein